MPTGARGDETKRPMMFGERAKPMKLIKRTVWILIGGVLWAGAGTSAWADRVDDLIQKLQSKTVADRRQAALEIGRTRDPRAVPPLIALLRDQEPLVRLDASGALMEIGQPAVAPLIEAVQSETDAVFLWNAIRVLEETGDPQALDALRAILKNHKDPSVQQIARYAIEKLERLQKP